MYTTKTIPALRSTAYTQVNVDLCQRTRHVTE